MVINAHRTMHLETKTRSNKRVVEGTNRTDALHCLPPYEGHDESKTWWRLFDSRQLIPFKEAKNRSNYRYCRDIFGTKQIR